MRTSARALLPIAIAAGLATPAAAQTADWSFALSPYVWLPGLSTSLGTDFGRVNADTSASDAISALDFAFMGAAEARNGRWGLILDLLYSDLSTSERTPFGVLFTKARVETRTTVATVYAGYRVVETEQAALDLLGGGRFFWLDIGLELTPGERDRFRTDLDDDWADPVLGARGRFDFADRWFATALADYGGFGGSSDQSWQALATAGYQFSPRWSAQAGWRYLSIEREIGGEKLELEMSGPIFGATLRF